LYNLHSAGTLHAPTHINLRFYDLLLLLYVHLTAARPNSPRLFSYDLWYTTYVLLCTLSKLR